MSCEAFQRRIAEAAAADLLPADVAAHVAACAACARAVAAEHHVRAVLAAASWPDSPLVHDLGRLRDRAAAREAARAQVRRARAWRWAGVAGALAALGWLGAQTRPAGVASPGAFPVAAVVLLAVSGAAWIGLDVAGRRMAAAGAPGRALLGLSSARAIVGLAVFLGLLHPAVLPALESSLWSAGGRPARAGTATFEASMLCAGVADGRLRLVPVSEGCRRHEQEVRSGPGGSPLLAPASRSAAGLEVRSGPAMIPAGFNGTSISFAQPMPNAGYHVVLSPHDWGRPFATDDACRFAVAGGKTASGFTINLRRCWFEGDTVPTDPAEVDLRLDWIAIETR